MGKYWIIPCCRVFGIRLELHLTFLILLVYFGWAGAMQGGFAGAVWLLLTVCAFFVCVVLHELGHCLTAMHYGIRTHRILLLPIGGLAQFERIPRSPMKELFITLAGPLVNFVIAAGLFFLHSRFFPVQPLDESVLVGYESETFYQQAGAFIILISVWNVAMGMFNLIPVFPMDGGRILRAALAFKFSYLTSTRVAVYCARPLIVIFIVAALFFLQEPHYLLAGLFAFIYLGGKMEYDLVKRQEAFRGLTVRDLTRYGISVHPADITVKEAIGVIQSLQPPEILASYNGRVVGVFSRFDLKTLAMENRYEQKLLEFCQRPPTTVQASWPFEMFYDIYRRQDRSVYPVYEGEQLIGVIDTSHLKESLYWYNRDRANREKPLKKADASFDKKAGKGMHL